MPNEPVVYVNKAGAERVVRTQEAAIKATFDGYKPKPEPKRRGSSAPSEG